MSKTKTQKAKELGLSKQAYAKRLETWIEVEINGYAILVNPNQVMSPNVLMTKADFLELAKKTQG